jgi:hypothetical protein
MLYGPRLTWNNSQNSWSRVWTSLGLIIFYNNKIIKYEDHIRINQIIKDEVGEKTIQMMKLFLKKRKKNIRGNLGSLAHQGP